MRFCLLAASIFMSSTAQAGVLENRELQSALVGQLIQWWESDGWQSGSLTLLPDGRAEISVEAPVGSVDAGHWNIRGNQLCTVWSSLRNREAKCYSVEQVAPNRFITSGGNVFEIVTAGV